MPNSSPSSSGAAASSSTVLVSRGVRTWVPLLAVVSAMGGVYYAAYRLRLRLIRWRMEERRRAEHQYELLENLIDFQHLHRSTSGNRVATHALAEDEANDGTDGDEEDEEEEDETAVSLRDTEEFRSSLGIILPRDEDLFAMIERMLLEDPVPDGWVLYRTTAGIIRFLNVNTQELSFFHPGKRREQHLIEAELQKRNMMAMESRYAPQHSHQGGAYAQDRPVVFSHSSRWDHRDGEGGVGAAHLTSSPSYEAPAGDDSHRTLSHTLGSEASISSPPAGVSMLRRMVNYFVEREQRRIQEDVARERALAVSSASDDDDDDEPDANMAAATRMFGGDRESPESAQRHSFRGSPSYRVVSSSALRQRAASGLGGGPSSDG